MDAARSPYLTDRVRVGSRREFSNLPLPFPLFPLTDLSCAFQVPPLTIAPSNGPTVKQKKTSCFQKKSTHYYAISLTLSLKSLHHSQFILYAKK